MKLSAKTRYGLRACFILALKNSGQAVPIGELVKDTSVSQKYLEKILQTLSKSDIVTTARGPAGGYRLKRPPPDITVGEIFRSLEDNLVITDCVGGLCTDTYCPNRTIMKTLYTGINSLLDGFTLQDIVSDNTCAQSAERA